MVAQLSPQSLALAGMRLRALRDADPWRRTARPNQRPPDGDWRTWFIQAGRGFGKTRTAAEWTRDQIMQCGKRRFALVGATAADVRDVMVEGESGLLVCCERYGVHAEYQPSRRRVLFPNGAKAIMYSADEPNRLRGPQHDGGWGDEIAAWRRPEAYENLDMGLRLGDDPRMVLTGTPKPVTLVRALVKRSHEPNSDVVVTRGALLDNSANLAPGFVAGMKARYAGTRIGRQELEGELLEDVEGALWTLTMIDATRLDAVPEQVRLVEVVVAIDPAASSGETSAETGIVVVARGSDNHGYVLDDRSLRGTPHEWAVEAVRAFDHWSADHVAPEVNNGGEMVTSTLQTVRPTLPIRPVHASRGKATRAEPVSALYEQGRIHHIGVFAALEDQQSTWVPGLPSPDRLDACLVAGTLIVTERGEIPIETVMVGDRVMTREGWRVVINAGMTNERSPVRTAVFSDGSALTGTGNHPVWTVQRGFSPLDALVWGDIMETWKKNDDAKTFGSREFATRVFPTHPANIKRTISGLLARAAKTLCIARFGRPFTARFRQGSTSITATKTSSTTIPTISHVSRRLTMLESTRSNIEKSEERGRQRFDRSPLNGTDHKRAALGTANTAKTLGRAARQTRSSVIGAARKPSGFSPIGMASTIAAASVIGLRLIPTIVTKSMFLARSAARHSSKTSTESNRRHAPVFVAHSYESGEAPVYNLTVQDTPEYFANGVLVHNCVWGITDVMLSQDDRWDEIGAQIDIGAFFRGGR